MTVARGDKPLPIPQPESDFYWRMAQKHELWVKQCIDCNKTYFYPRDICPTCFSRNTTWSRSSGRGILYTFAIVHRPPIAAFSGDVPYIVALVELEDGARIPTNLVDIEPDPKKIKIGMSVEVVFDDVTEDVTLPKFKPAIS